MKLLDDICKGFAFSAIAVTATVICWFAWQAANKLTHDCATSQSSERNRPLLKAETATDWPFTYVIVIDAEKQAYVNGVPIEAKPLQKLLGVEQDGKIGPETIGMVIKYNRLDKIK